MLKHGVEGDEQFAHTRDNKGHLLRLTRGQQSLIEADK